MIASLLTESNETIARNFLLLDKIKNSQNVIKPELKARNRSIYCFIFLLTSLRSQFSFTENRCDPSEGRQAVRVKVSVEAPALFVYAQITHPQISSFDLSKNGFIQYHAEDFFTMTFPNANCSIEFTEKNVDIVTVNDFISLQ